MEHSAVHLPSTFRNASTYLANPSRVRGKTAIVTRSNGGIGLECCRQLEALGLAKLIIAVRDEDTGVAAKEQLSADQDTLLIEIWNLNFSSYDSIRSFAERANRLERLDIVILNAGSTRLFFRVNPLAGRKNVQTNYLSTALLIILPLPVLKAKVTAQQSRPSRLVLVTSDLRVGLLSQNRIPTLCCPPSTNQAKSICSTVIIHLNYFNCSS